MSSKSQHPGPRDSRGDWADALRLVGMRVTGPRLAVLETVAQHPHATVESVVSDIVRTLPRASAQTVYGVLGMLESNGLIRRIEIPGSSWRYETRVADNHHHLVCTACGRIEDVDCVVGHAPCLHPSDDHGFTLRSADIVFSGLCPACQKQPTAEQKEELHG